VPTTFGTLPAGTSLHPLDAHVDDRGSLVELWRASWPSGARPVQWNGSRSAANVLRGVHIHVRHTDYLVVVMGRAVIGLRDLRGDATTVALVDLDGDAPEALVIPPGVAHGFYFPEPSLHCYAVNEEFDPTDELGCRFDDPALGIPWPTTDVVLSERDRDLPLLAELMSSHRLPGGAVPARPS
jgi:dTDP-4-dehydrorhamnose 3,5-epimerase